MKTSPSIASVAIPLEGTPALDRPRTEPAKPAPPPYGGAIGSAEARADWIVRRSYMETHHEKVMPDGRHRWRRIKIFRFLINRFGTLLRLTGLFRRGVANAADVRLNRMELAFQNLPESFDGFTMLHLTDLHLDGLPAATQRLTELVAEIDADICVMTGDYRFGIQGGFDAIMAPMEALVRAISSREGIYAILGNHDTVDMVEPFERLGLRVLANESVTIARGGDKLNLTGLDDVHYYYTERATEALWSAPAGFGIALVHSPEIAESAAESGMSLYLTGHTHGGQICLPWGRPILTDSSARRAFASGLWRCGAMVGYTSPGAGISGLPVRYFSRGEAMLITLRRG